MIDKAARPLEGKVAFVTGASRRIGKATALGLAADGARIVVTARTSQDEIEAVADEIRQSGSEALPLLMDMSDESSVKAAVAAADKQFGRIDILVNNAAIRQICPFLEMDLAEWRYVMGINLDGVFLVTRHVLPVIVRGGGGTVVTIGGSTAHTGADKRAHVAASKAAHLGLMKSLAVEFADRNVTFNCVAPGMIGGERSATSGNSPLKGDDVVLGRLGEIGEAAFVVRMMCQPGARFMTGQTVHVNGGRYMP
jgi:3-oxoacyl-[acyl-carrier protein] reductase